jgi:hypothetical protein
MEYSAIVAGTGFEGREERIRALVRPGMEVYLVPEPTNKFDPNAIAVFVPVKKWYTFFFPAKTQIGYVKKDRAAFLKRKMDEGGKILGAEVVSMYTEKHHPRVSLIIKTDW